MKNMGIPFCLFLCFIMLLGTSTESSAYASQNSTSLILLQNQHEGLMSLVVKKGDHLRLAIKNNEDSCETAGYEIYSAEPIFKNTVNLITEYEEVNLVAKDSVKVGVGKEYLFEVDSDGTYYVHVLRYLRKCGGWDPESKAVEATFVNLGQ